MKQGKVILGMLAGVTAGALLGILFAPDKGSETRKNLMKKSNEYADDVKDKFDDMLDAIQDKYESIMCDADALAAKGTNKYNEVKREIKNVL